MLVTCVPGTRGVAVWETMRQVSSELQNLSSGPPGGANDAAALAQAWVVAYLEWASNTARMLRFMISSGDIDRLVLTKRYELILSTIGSVGRDGLQRVINGLVATEIDHRVAALNSVIASLDARLRMWERTWEPFGAFVAVDSSFILNHPQKLDEADFAELLDVREAPIHVMVPMVVVDELDRLKEVRNNDHVRWRSGQALAVLEDRSQRQVEGPVLLREADSSALGHGGIPRGQVTIEIVPDPPEHVPLAVDDEEIVQRVKSWEPLTPNGKITFMTYDTGQAHRARLAGLSVWKGSKSVKEPKTSLPNRAK
jgi:hypothetical protein